MIKLSDQQIQDALNRYHNMKAELNRENEAHDVLRAAQKALLQDRYGPKKVTLKTTQSCVVCGESLPVGSEAYWRSGQIGANAGHNGFFIKSKYICLRCWSVSK
jgi:hypothetical protein